jgi:hypothetical protein
VSNWGNKNLNTAAERARAERYKSPEHKAARKLYRTLQAQGVVLTCWRCRKPIPPIKGACHVGHDDAGLRIMGPEHAKCNRSAANSKGARVKNAMVKASKAAPFVRPKR